MDVDEKEKAAFGSHWCGPAKFSKHGMDLVAKYDDEPDNDGQPAEVYCSACPAMFYIIKALPGANSVGDKKSGWQMGTGSGDEMRSLAIEMAKAVAGGMLSLDEEPVA